MPTIKCTQSHCSRSCSDCPLFRGSTSAASDDGPGRFVWVRTCTDCDIRDLNATGPTKRWLTRMPWRCRHCGCEHSTAERVWFPDHHTAPGANPAA